MKKMHVVGESRWDSFKVGVNNAVEDAKMWCRRNPEIVAGAVITVVTTVVPMAYKKRTKMRTLKKAEAVKNLYCYDRSLGHYWKLRRELTNDEWRFIDKRKATGERLADILADLNVLY